MSRPVEWLLALTVAVVAASAIVTVIEVRDGDRPSRQGARVAASAAASTTTTMPTTTAPAEAGTVRPAGDEPLRLAIDGMSSAPAASATTRARHVVLWGDSLAHESAGYFEWSVRHRPGVEVETRTFGGTAACDWFAEIMHWPKTRRVDIAVLEFSGNWGTHCMRGPKGRRLTAPERVAKYRTDVEAEAVHLRDHGATVLLVGPPVFRPDFEPNRVEALIEVYREIAARHEGVEFVDAGASVLDGGRYTERLPCAPWEGADQGCVDGTVAVRSPDGVHFCPTDPLRTPCPVFSAGAFRFGLAMADAVTAELS